MLLHLVADFGTGDLAFAEVAQRFALHLPDARIWPTAVPPFATLAAGFLVAQLALGDGPDDRAVFHNVAPRRDDAAARRDNDGERLLHARLPDGVQVVGVDAGHAFSFLAEAGAELRTVEVATSGSQFRSRDLFPAAAVAALRGEGLGDALPRDAVPPVPSGRIAYADGFGNLKTTIDEADAPPAGTEVEIEIAGVRRTGLRAGGTFAVAHGGLAFAPGSSGWRLPDGRARRWMEVFLRGGSARSAFDHPAVESEVRVAPAGR
jgi:S-adenosylmethionine hydrolase